MSNHQISHLNSLLRQYHNNMELSRAMTEHLLSLNADERTDFAVAMIMEICAARAVMGCKQAPAKSGAAQ